MTHDTNTAKQYLCRGDYYNLEINNLETYNFKIIGKKISENNTNKITINNKPYVKRFIK